MAEPVLKKGSTDPAVKDLQEALKTLGFDPGPVDGIPGPLTRTALYSRPLAALRRAHRACSLGPFG